MTEWCQLPVFLILPVPHSQEPKWDRFCLHQSLLPATSFTTLFFLPSYVFFSKSSQKGCFFWSWGFSDYCVRLGTFGVPSWRKLNFPLYMTFSLSVPSAVPCLSPCSHPAFSLQEHSYSPCFPSWETWYISSLFLFLSCLPGECPFRSKFNASINSVPFMCLSLGFDCHWL